MATPARPVSASTRFSSPRPDLPVLVTGGGGFIGGWLIADLLRQGHTQIRAVDIKAIEQWHQVHSGVENVVLDLSDLASCRRATDGMGVVFNLAADMGGMGFIETHKAECMLSVLISTHMLVAARDAGVKRFAYASSACVYNAAFQNTFDVAPLREGDAYPAMPEDGYGWEKLFSERMARHFREDFGIATRVVRFHNVYGPEGAWTGGREKAPAALCRKVALAELTGRHEIEIWGDGRQTRSFTYVDDAVFGLQLVAWGDVTDPLNVGSSELVSINQMVGIVEAVADITLERSYDLGAPKGVRGRNSDNTRILAEYGWEPSTRLADGLAATYRWVRKQVAAQLVAEGTPTVGSGHLASAPSAR